MAIMGLLGFASALTFAWLVYRAHEHRQWHQRVDILILRLARNRPPDVTPECWTFCVQWTRMLHGEYGGLYYFPAEEREPFVRDLERHLAVPATLWTIDAIWDDYVRHAPKAKSYLKYRPTTPEMQQAYSTDQTIESLIRELERLEQPPG